MVFEKIKQWFNTKRNKQNAKRKNSSLSTDTQRVSLYTKFKFPNILIKKLNCDKNTSNEIASPKKRIFIYDRNGSFLNDEILCEGTRR